MKEYFKKNIEKINDAIEKIVVENENNYNSNSKYIKEYLDLFKATTYGGKRIRALLVVLGYEMNGGEISEEIYKAAAAYEIFQAGILIHDDVIDESELRRGIETIHCKLGNDHLAKSNAICLGDYGLFLSQRILSNLKFPPERLIKAIDSFNVTTLNTVIGEILDVNLPFKNTTCSEDVLDIAYYKTAWYTIIGPLTLGSILAGANNEVLKEIKNYGTHLGIAFQMKDDLLGIYGDKEVLGKSIMSDIKEKKLTLLYTSMMNKISKNEIEEKDKKIFLDMYGKKDITFEECKDIKCIFDKYDIRKEAEKTIEEECAKTIESIKNITNNEEWREILKQLIEKMTVRDK